MDESSSSSLMLMIVLTFVNALITLAYAALVNTKENDLQEQADEGNRTAQRGLDLLDVKSRLYITYNLSNTLLTSGVAIAAAWGFLIPALTGNTTPLSNLVLGIMLTLFSVVLSFVFGNILPEAIGSAYTKFFTQFLTRPLAIWTALLTPLTILMLFVSRGLARAFGSDKLVNTVTEEEIMTLVNAGYTGGALEVEEKAMIYSVLQLDQTIAREMMIPRIDVTAVEVSTPIEEAMDVFIKTGYSRIPVYEENIDSIVGLLYAKDLLNLMNNGGLAGHTVREMVRTAYFVPESKPAHELLRELQARKVHMAIVVDEYGGTSGLLTIENIIEEIVGDIRDEYDHNEEYEYIQIGEQEYVIDAGMDLDDINDLLDISLSTENTDTLGGFIYMNIERVPIVGETLETDDVVLQVRSLEGRRIRKVQVQIKLDSDDQEAEQPPTPEEPVPATDSDEPSQSLADAS